LSTNERTKITREETTTKVLREREREREKADDDDDGPGAASEKEDVW
jgi:hypothetical protein